MCVCVCVCVCVRDCVHVWTTHISIQQVHLICLLSCCPQKPFIPHWMRDSLPAGSSISRDLGHDTHQPPNSTQSPTLTPYSMKPHAVFKVQPKNKSTSCLPHQMTDLNFIHVAALWKEMLVFYMFWWEFIDYIEVYSHYMLIFAAKQSDESVKSVRIVWHFCEIC